MSSATEIRAYDESSVTWSRGSYQRDSVNSSSRLVSERVRTALARPHPYDRLDR